MRDLSGIRNIISNIIINKIVVIILNFVFKDQLKKKIEEFEKCKDDFIVIQVEQNEELDILQTEKKTLLIKIDVSF